jgi:hypothetical protein
MSNNQKEPAAWHWYSIGAEACLRLEQQTCRMWQLLLLLLTVCWRCAAWCVRCRSVSYVPAAYYAHLAAFRGRLMKREVDEGSVVSSGSGERAPEVLQIPVSGV